MKKTIVLDGILMLAVLVFSVLAGVLTSGDVETISPLTPSGLDFYYVLDTSGNVMLICNATPNSGQIIDNVSFYFATPYDNSSSWAVNTTNSTVGAVSTEVTRQVYIQGIPDGKTYTFGCYACDNASNCSYSATNQTIRTERPPTVTLKFPADNNKTNAGYSDIMVNFTTNSTTTSDTNFYCRVYVNDTTLNWSESAQGYTAINNTEKSILFDYPNEGDWIWNVRCRESSNENIYAFASANRTITIDTTNPSINALTPADESYKKSTTVAFTLNASDIRLSNCALYLNTSGTWVLNVTNATITSNKLWTISKVFASANKDVLYGVYCNDTTLNYVFGTNRTLHIDTSTPHWLGVTNESSTNCTAFYLNWSTNEATNATFRWGTSTAMGGVSTDSSFSLNHSHLIDFVGNEDTLFYFNWTNCDRADNCNSSITAQTISPISLCEGGTNDGWNLYAILESSINFSDILTESGADYVYWWNESGQAWKYTQAGTTTNAATTLIYGDSVFLYEATGSNWWRTDTSTGTYYYNITSGDNFIGLGKYYTFYNLSVESMNESITEYGWYNNSAQDWKLHYWNVSWNNATILSRGEVAWIWSDQNISWNTTDLNTTFG